MTHLTSACKQPYWICLIDWTLNGGDKVLVAYVHRVHCDSRHRILTHRRGTFRR